MNPNTTTQKYSTLLFLINNFYMDTVNMQRLTEKAIIARDLFNQNAYFEILSPMDHAIQKALEVMKNNKAFKEMNIKTQ